ncbi:hypothetical protein J19TS2_03670 [Cohnella xylanilytica]|uniref:XdhC family protein n=1 Tax=Cohnella xylanilytica TaxID=557555 RepID=A0A841TQA4_9BACL|nr:XdhC/CoxI family protein [Cohnella xylanilytica]MBB6690335.1 XdhC family protein [Cohnella xylanilytica]GIO10812.1 hypothetical protein J19TS2_03670 [Cohnella xylanilytica]
MDAYDILRRLAESEEPAVLATVVGVEGHAYRKAGAAMLFTAEGGKIGSISPGCLESDLRERVPALLESGEPEIVAYDMRPEEDAIWGESVGCGGRLRILLEPVAGELRRVLREARRLNEAGAAVRLLRYAEPGGIRYEAEVEADAGSRGSAAANPALAAAAPTNSGSTAAAAAFASVPASGKRASPSSAERPWFETTLAPRPRLVLFGAGGDLDPIFRQAAALGFRIAVADWRPGLATPERFPGAELATGTAGAIVQALGVGPSDYAIVCGHQLRKDREMIEALLPIEPAYLGVMGSRRRIELLFEGLPKPPFVRAPVGLDIGADGPEEIAVSVAAELVAVRGRGRSRKGGGGDADSRHSAGGWPEPKNGEAEAVPRACSR